MTTELLEKAVKKVLGNQKKNVEAQLMQVANEVQRPFAHLRGGLTYYNEEGNLYISLGIDKSDVSPGFPQMLDGMENECLAMLSIIKKCKEVVGPIPKVAPPVKDPLGDDDNVKEQELS